MWYRYVKRIIAERGRWPNLPLEDYIDWRSSRPQGEDNPPLDITRPINESDLYRGVHSTLPLYDNQEETRNLLQQTISESDQDLPYQDLRHLHRRVMDRDLALKYVREKLQPNLDAVRSNPRLTPEQREIAISRLERKIHDIKAGYGYVHPEFLKRFDDIAHGDKPNEDVDYFDPEQIYDDPMIGVSTVAGEYVPYWSFWGKDTGRDETPMELFVGLTFDDENMKHYGIDAALVNNRGWKIHSMTKGKAPFAFALVVPADRDGNWFLKNGQPMWIVSQMQSDFMDRMKLFLEISRLFDDKNKDENPLDKYIMAKFERYYKEIKKSNPELSREEACRDFMKCSAPLEKDENGPGRKIETVFYSSLFELFGIRANETQRINRILEFAKQNRHLIEHWQEFLLDKVMDIAGRLGFGYVSIAPASDMIARMKSVQWETYPKPRLDNKIQKLYDNTAERMGFNMEPYRIPGRNIMPTGTDWHYPLWIKRTPKS